LTSGLRGSALYRARLRHTSTIVPAALINHYSLLLDIDVFRTEQIPNRDDELWKVVDEVRGVKDGIFEGCITQKSRELFDAK
jgi:uncharacterized protein (TIGR04255 family)